MNPRMTGGDKRCQALFKRKEDLGAHLLKSCFFGKNPVYRIKSFHKEEK